MREAVTRENAKTLENENHSVEDLTPQGEWPVCRYLDRQASNRPASRLQAPHERAQASARHLRPGERQG
jgi:hypothetical protein